MEISKENKEKINNDSIKNVSNFFSNFLHYNSN